MDEIELIEPRTIDEARMQMVHQLHRALYGATWARSETPSAVWNEMLDRVERISRACRR